MLDFLGAGENLAFVIALVIMLLIGLVEAIGLGSSALGHDIDIDGDGTWLGWLGFGALPLLMLLVIYLAYFGLIGLVGQQFALNNFSALLPSWIAAPIAGAVALPLTGSTARMLAKVIPRDETTAIDIDRLIGLHAEIVVGTAMRGSPAKARVHDFHGQVHYVMAEPDDVDIRFSEGDEILLVRREKNVFRAISSGRQPFSNWIEP